MSGASQRAGAVHMGTPLKREPAMRGYPAPPLLLDTPLPLRVSALRGLCPKSSDVGLAKSVLSAVFIRSLQQERRWLGLLPHTDLANPTQMATLESPMGTHWRQTHHAHILRQVAGVSSGKACNLGVQV